MSMRGRVRVVSNTVVLPVGQADEPKNWKDIKTLTALELTTACMDCIPQISNIVQSEHRVLWDEICRRLQYIQIEAVEQARQHHLEHCCLTKPHEPKGS